LRPDFVGRTVKVFAISCEGLVIGHSAFEARGLPRGVVRGRFLPAADYESVRPLFRRDAVVRARPEDPDGETVLRAYYETRADLRFAVSDDQDRSVPVEYVHVYEPDGPGGTFEVAARLAVPGVPRDPRSRPRRSRPAT
jgi:hypothetical protein